jgi:hypothetical protein
MKKLSVITAMAFIAFITTTNTGCKKEDNPVAAVPTLYDSLGGTTMVADPKGGMIEKGRLGIRSVVDSTIFVIAGDPQLNGFFPTLLSEVTSGNLTGFNALSKNLTDFFCVATGAKNFTYTGKNMVDAHDPAKNPRMPSKSSNANFDRFIVDLVKGAQQVGLSNDLIGRVGRVTETTRTAVVQR